MKCLQREPGLGHTTRLLTPVLLVLHSPLLRARGLSEKGNTYAGTRIAV